MNLDDAIAKHGEWRVKFRMAITKQETFSADVSRDNVCELGKWLHGEAKGLYGETAAYAECLSKHAAFHVEAGKIASAINAKRYTEATAMMAPGAPYMAASSAVGVAISHLKTEAASRT